MSHSTISWQTVYVISSVDDIIVTLVLHDCRKLLSNSCAMQADTGLPLHCAALHSNMHTYVSNNERQFFLPCCVLCHMHLIMQPT